MIEKEGATRGEEAAPETDCNSELNQQVEDTAGDEAAAAVFFLRKLAQLGVAVWAAEPADPREVGMFGPEFYRPTNWQKLQADGSLERLLAQFRYPTEAYPLTSALCANMGGVVAVVDVDPRNGGDIEKVRNLLAHLSVRIFAEVTSPSGGKHFYVAGHEALPSVHSTIKNGRLPGFPGVDIQSFGTNVFLPGTWRWKKYGGAGYTIEFEDLDAVAVGDPKGAEAFAQWVAECLADRAKTPAQAKTLAQERRSDFTFEKVEPWAGGAPNDREQNYLDKVLEENAQAVAQATPGGRNDALYLAALKCASFVGGAGMDGQLVVAVLEAAAEDCGLVEDDRLEAVRATINSAFRIGLQNPRAVPNGSTKVGGHRRREGELQRLEDAHIGRRIADDYLADQFLYAGGFGWMQFDGRRWKHVEDTIVAEEVRQGVIDFHRREALAGADADRLKQISGLFSAHRLKAILWVAKGYLSVDDAEFDAHPDLLNVGNGVIDLRDGSLRRHDPGLRLTKVAMVDYQRDASHEDWQQALGALPYDAVEWLQLRWGQGLTGYPPPDDVMVVLKGAGENGKTTFVDAIREALGPDYAVTLPDRVLLARNGDHPTELMTLRGARVGVMEEFPELGHLNVKRLKDVQGTGRISARYIGKDAVSWQVTHSIFVTTNYLPRVDESDHGTWRRLALVEFPFRYRKPHEPLETPSDRRGDPGLRDRLRSGSGGRHEAVLAWLVRGAVLWYQSDRLMAAPPPSVVSATQKWRKSADLLLRYMDDNLVFDCNAHVMAKELFEDFAAWLKANGHMPWTDQNFSARLGQHPVVVAAGVEKIKGIRSTRGGLSRSPCPHSVIVIPNQYAAWVGVRFRTREEVDFTPGVVA